MYYLKGKYDFLISFVLPVATTGEAHLCAKLLLKKIPPFSAKQKLSDRCAPLVFFTVSYFPMNIHGCEEGILYFFALPSNAQESVRLWLLFTILDGPHFHHDLYPSLLTNFIQAAQNTKCDGGKHRMNSQLCSPPTFLCMCSILCDCFAGAPTYVFSDVIVLIT